MTFANAVPVLSGLDMLDMMSWQRDFKQAGFLFLFR